MTEYEHEKENRLSDHPTPADLEAFGRGELPNDRVRAVVRHLLSRCPSCLAAAPAALSIGLASHTSPESEAAYDAAIDRAYTAARSYKRRRQTLQDRAREVINRLEAQGVRALETLPRKYCGLPLVEALLKRSWDLRHEDPSQMVELLNIAALVSRDLNAQDQSPQQIADLQCRVWSELANAYRVAEDLEQAQAAFDCAYEHMLDSMSRSPQSRA